MDLLKQIFEAGVVGAGGAGFPTHKKLTDKADTLVLNAAECEPLLASDRYVMRHYAEEIISSLLAQRQVFRFCRVVIGIKEKYVREIAALKAAIEKYNADIDIHTVDSFYPAGDEQTLIYEITGKAVPPGGIPLLIGVVVVNVTTAYQIFMAMQGSPFTKRIVTVTGEVGTPVLVQAPIGTSFEDCIAAAGGTVLEDYTIIRGGPMMGKQIPGQEAEVQSIGKTDGGLIVLDNDHPLIQFSKKPLEHMLNQAKSVCIQCSYCTEMCPRYLIGHKMRPNRVMRSLATGTNTEDLTDALLCCECGICELYACPMQLSPRRMNMYVKDRLRKEGVKVTDQTLYPAQSEMREYRRIAQSRFIDRLGLSEYPTQLDRMVTVRPDQVRISMKHGVGKPAAALVSPGDIVKKDQVIAAVDFADVGCLVHASISGQVTEVDEGFITIRREEDDE